MAEKLETGFVDHSKKTARTRKRVATFEKQVRKGVRDMKVNYVYTCTSTAVHSACTCSVPVPVVATTAVPAVLVVSVVLQIAMVPE